MSDETECEGCCESEGHKNRCPKLIESLRTKLKASEAESSKLRPGLAREIILRDSYKARAEKAEAEVERLRDALENDAEYPECSDGDNTFCPGSQGRECKCGAVEKIKRINQALAPKTDGG